MRMALVVVLASACSFHPQDTTDAAPGSDGSGGGSDGSASGSDGSGSGSGSGSCDWAVHLDVCNLDPGGAVLSVTTNTTFNTDDGSVNAGQPINSIVTMQKNGGNVRVIVVESASVADNVTFRAVGALPLVIYSTAAITLAGTIDVESRVADNGLQMAGSRTTNACLGEAGNNGLADQGGPGAGGGGGGFGGHGGDGGTNDTNDSAGGGGMAEVTPNRIIGGCPGGNGAPGSTLAVAAGGSGGGAVELIAAGAITLNMHGQILAGGAGGQACGQGGSNTEGGGAGGGAGGYIGMDTLASITLTGAMNHVAANGGGGGAGGKNLGTPGDDGHPDTARANGGPKNGGGSDGGKGGAGAAATQDGVTAAAAGADSGGGGGGGVGYILLRSPNAVTNKGTISPDPVTL